MVMHRLNSTFKRKHPPYGISFTKPFPREFLPASQIVSGGLTVGNLHLRISPDIYESGKEQMDSMVQKALFWQKR